MSVEPSDGYKLAAMKLIGEAIDRRDGEAAVAVLELARLNGYGRWAAEVTDHLVRVGLESVVGGR